MTAATDTKTKEKKGVSCPQFAIEADHPRNANLKIQCIHNCILRSAISSSRTITDIDGNVHTTIDQSIGLGGLPRIPGQILQVDPQNLRYKVSAPLVGDEATLQKLKTKASKLAFGVQAFAGVPESVGSIDIHWMKTLIRECRWLVDAGEATLVKGVLPTLEEINELEGRFITNPGSVAPNTQPFFEDEFEDWMSDMRKTRG